MSGVIKTIKKSFKKNPILTTIVVGAAIWWTAGVASAYMATPGAGIGSAMSSSATSMWTTATNFVSWTGGFVSGADVAFEQAAAKAALLNGVEVGAVAGAGVPTAVGTKASAATLAAEGGAAASETALYEASLAGGAMPAAVAPPPPSTGLVQNAAKWMGNNPIPTMILGQAGVGAYSGYLEEKGAADARSDANLVRTDRGTRGYDWQGNYAGNQGIVQSQQVEAPKTVAQTVSPPVVQAPTTQSPTARPVDRNNLPQLQRQGLVAPNRMA